MLEVAAQPSFHLPRFLEFRPDPRALEPSILRQTPYETGFFVFPKRYRTQYFNPSVVDWLGTRWLVTRRRRYAAHPGRNDITFWRLRNTDLLDERAVRFLHRRADENWEDPRAIVHNNSLILSYCNFFTFGPWVGQGVARLNTYLQADATAPVYGANAARLIDNRGWEKNWIWFEHDGRLHFVYSTRPHIVVACTDSFTPREDYHTPGITIWRYGLPRGGTPPVYVPSDNLYWSFFHSSLDLHPKIAPRRRYYLGAYAFEATPPFRVRLHTRTPLLAGSEEDPRDLGAPLCVFPCGALLDSSTWFVTLGVNDCACAWMRIPHCELLRLSYVA